MLHNKNNDKGFSMIELIVTIAIMGIVTISAIGIYSWTASSTFKDAYKNITDSMAYARTEQLAKAGSWIVEIELNTDKYTTAVYKDVIDPTKPKRKVENKKAGVKVFGVKKDDGSLIELNSGSIHLEYNSNGTFKDASINGTDIKGIKVEYSRYSTTIKLALGTGKFFID